VLGVSASASRLGSVARGWCLVPRVASVAACPSDVPRAPTGPVSGCEILSFGLGLSGWQSTLHTLGASLASTRDQDPPSVGLVGVGACGQLPCNPTSAFHLCLSLIVHPRAPDRRSTPRRVRYRPSPGLQLDPSPKVPSPSPTRRLPLAAGGRAWHAIITCIGITYQTCRGIYQARRRILVPVTTPRCRPRLSKPR
jgi:hypothetical protein